MKYFDDGCGGYGFGKKFDTLFKLYTLAGSQFSSSWEPSWNIRPGAMAPVIIQDVGGMVATIMKWGLVPSWWKQDPHRVGFSNINARAEDVQTKPFWRGPFKNKRCLVPCDFFYEWALDAGDPKIKQPELFKMKSGDTFSFAGLYDEWEGAEKKIIQTYTIITCPPNDLVAKYHSRMPVILPKDKEEDWANNKLDDFDYLQSLLAPLSAKEMEAYHVSRDVSNSRNDGDDLIKKIPEVPIKPSVPAWQNK